MARALGAGTCRVPGQVDHETAEQSAASGASLNQFVDEGFAHRFRRTSRMNARRRAALNSLRDLQKHKAWSAGTGTSAFGSGPDTSKVVLGSDDEMARLAAEIFGYDRMQSRRARVP